MLHFLQYLDLARSLPDYTAIVFPHCACDARKTGNVIVTISPKSLRLRACTTDGTPEVRSPALSRHSLVPRLPPLQISVIRMKGGKDLRARLFTALNQVLVCELNHTPSASSSSSCTHHTLSTHLFPYTHTHTTPAPHTTHLLLSPKSTCSPGTLSQTMRRISRSKLSPSSTTEREGAHDGSKSSHPL